MDANTIVMLFSTGGVLYLLVDKVLDKVLNRKKDKVENETTIISNSNEIAELYSKIDEIVESKTAPICAELKEIKENWCCYRANCKDRLMVKPREE